MRLEPRFVRRYTDLDPILERARRVSNLTVYEEYGDLRYMLRNARVLVSARPASTTGVVVMSGKPVVYIVVPGRPLSPEARPYMERGLFLFDGNDPASVAGARQRWTAHKAAGHQLAYWQQNEGGQWEKA